MGTGGRRASRTAAGARGRAAGAGSFAGRWRTWRRTARGETRCWRRSRSSARRSPSARRTRAAEAAAKALVRLTRGRDGGGPVASPDEMLLAVRAVTYLCDAIPRAADAVVRHGLLPVLCSRLLAIEYLDVAEQVTKQEPAPRPSRFLGLILSRSRRQVL
ncbi:hypothetical protein ACQ4PT_016794 [Festuca glaucescens]